MALRGKCPNSTPGSPAPLLKQIRGNPEYHKRPTKTMNIGNSRKSQARKACLEFKNFAAIRKPPASRNEGRRLSRAHSARLHRQLVPSLPVLFKDKAEPGMLSGCVLPRPKTPRARTGGTRQALANTRAGDNDGRPSNQPRARLTKADRNDHAQRPCCW